MRSRRVSLLLFLAASLALAPAATSWPAGPLPPLTGPALPGPTHLHLVVSGSPPYIYDVDTDTARAIAKPPGPLDSWVRPSGNGAFVSHWGCCRSHGRVLSHPPGRLRAEARRWRQHGARVPVVRDLGASARFRRPLPPEAPPGLACRGGRAVRAARGRRRGQRADVDEHRPATGRRAHGARTRDTPR